MHCRFVIFFFLLASILPGQPSFANVSVNVPTGHWSYVAIDKLSSLGLIQSSMRSTKPFTRMEMARLTLEAQGQIEEILFTREKSKPDRRLEIIQAILNRLKAEFSAELYELEGGGETRSYIKPLEDIYIHYMYGDKDLDIENDKGQELAKDSNIRAGFSTHGVLFNSLGYYLNPEYRYSEGKFGDRDYHVDILEGYGKLELLNIELEVGRDSMWWGTGRHGSLILTDNARPLDLIKLSNPRPVLLPWIFKYMGLFKFVVFRAELESSRTVPDAELLGSRIHIKPFPFLDIGLSRTIMLGGEGGSKGVGDLSLSQWGTVLSGRNVSGELDTNQIGGIDFEFHFPNLDRWVPMLKSVNFWGEWYGEDEAEGRPSHEGYVAGIKFGDIFLTGRTDLILEYADNVVSGIPGLWYGHHVYRTGYRFEGEIMGHHMGGDARDYLVRLEHYLSPDLILGLDYNSQERNVQAAIREDRDRFDLDLTYQGYNGVLVRAGYRFEAIDNLGQVKGNDQENNIFWIFFDYSF